MMQWLTKDWGLKLISLALAIGLWYYAAGEEDIEVTRQVPLEIKIKSSQMSILKTSVHSIQVAFLAPRASLSDLASEKIFAVHEIGEEVKKPGDYSFRLEARDINVPSPQVRIGRIEPEVVTVTLDELIVQKLSVKPVFVGEPAIGYKVIDSEIQIDPNAILVEGPKGKIEKLDAIATERIDLVGRIRPFRRTVALDLPPHVKALSEALVDTYIPIREELAEKIFEAVPVRVLNNSGDGGRAVLEPNKISFSLKGPKRKLDTLILNDILAYVDLTSLPSGEHDVPVSLRLPEEVSLKENTPLSIQVHLKK
ncbi:MAG: hypothetical protein HYZ85_05195 [Candidatus Omnitrophica bacterium]|nr:hypothetical protein [Candidatus Omnitrophota bacterium]